MTRALTLPVLWLLAALSLVVVAVLYHLSSALDDGGRHRVEVAVNEMVALDIAANLEVLKLRQRQKLDYDALVAAGLRIEELLVRIEPEFTHVGLDKSLAQAREAWREKQAGIEYFKRLNAVISTAQFHFVNLSEDLGRNQESALLNKVSRRLLAFLMQGGNDDLPLLVVAMYQLEGEIGHWPLARRTEGKMLVTHGSLILGNFRQVQQVSREVLDSPFADALAAAYRDYSKAQQQAATVANRYRTAMAGFTLLLVASVVLALLQLRHSAREVERSHRLLDIIADNLGEGILAFDAGGRVKFVNQRAETLIGRSESELLGRAAGEVLFAQTGQDAANPVLAAIAAGDRFSGEDWIAADNKRLPAGFMGGPLPADPQEADHAAYVLSFRDLSEVREAQARLHLAAHVFDSLAEAMVITDSKGVIQFVNPAFTTITGFSEEDARGKKPGSLLASGQHDAEFFGAMWAALRETGQWQGEIINRRKNGEAYTEWLSISAVRDGDGRLIQYIGLFSDISDRKEAEAYIHHLAYHDPLTGLANRRLFRDRLDTAMRLAQRANRPLALMIFDLDRFKVVNDSLGHEAGDHLLKEVARRINGCVRDCDTLARLGGDEFALLMPEIRDGGDATRVAAKLSQVLEPAVDLDGREIFVTTSIGIATYPEHGDSGEELLRNADVALYEAKNAGRNTWCTFDPDSREHAGDRLELEGALRHALERQELVLHYQLQLDADSKRISGAEALLRWQHPTRGLMLPDRFISLAEQTGLIEDIGAWCLEAACRQFVQWRAEGIPIPRIAVNVSARQLRATGFAERVMEIVARIGIDPGCLELELTESMLSENTELAFSIFTQLRQQGVRIAIDDFGTGYSSLNYLAQYPVDVLKIDRSFVRRLSDQSEASYVVRAIILLAQSMKMETVAEGVEVGEQQSQLIKLGCNHLQGFLFARPQPPETLAELISQLQAPEAR